MITVAVFTTKNRKVVRDLFDGVSYIHYHLFYHLEDNGVLEPSNPQHLFSLHYVYVPRINRHIEKWKQGFVRHRIRTAGNRSPMQLYILGLLNLRSSRMWLYVMFLSLFSGKQSEI